MALGPDDLLGKAAESARRLAEAVEIRKRDLDSAAAGSISQEQLQQGRVVMEKALDAARGAAETLRRDSTIQEG